MAQITFKTGTLTFKGGTFSFKRPYFWSYVATYSSDGNYGQDLDFSGAADGDFGTMVDIMEAIEPASNYPEGFALFYDTDTQEYYLFVSTQY